MQPSVPVIGQSKRHLCDCLLGAVCLCIHSAKQCVHVWHKLRLCVESLFKKWLRFREFRFLAKDLTHDGIELWIIGILFQGTLCQGKCLVQLRIGKQGQTETEQGACVLRSDRQRLSVFLFRIRIMFTLTEHVTEQYMQCG